MIDFIGVGAQKSGTSWIHACLYEHSEICSPVKEIHFFSRERFQKGKEWYESHFDRCESGLHRGEFSTSYLYSKDTPARIKALYPQTKLIAVLRNPLDRAYSQFRNAIKAGEIDKKTTFDTYVTEEKSVFEQGKYAEQLKRYFEYFPKEQMLVLIYEDSKKDPQSFISSIYAFLDVDEEFVPPSLETQINVARTPKKLGPEKMMHSVAERLRRSGLDRLVWLVKRSGIPSLVRRVNTERDQSSSHKPDLSSYADLVRDDVFELSTMLDRDLVTEWNV